MAKLLAWIHTEKSWYSGVDAAGKAIYSYTQNGVVKGAGYQTMTTAEMITRYSLK